MEEKIMTKRGEKKRENTKEKSRKRKHTGETKVKRVGNINVKGAQKKTQKECMMSEKWHVVGGKKKSISW